MTNLNNDIRFAKLKSNFYNDLCLEVKNLVTVREENKARKLILVKMFFYAFVNVALYSLLYVTSISTNQAALILCYCLFGLSGILLAFNCSHDAVHNTLFRSKRANAITHYLIFNLQGVNATLWKRRHISSHHIFPNVDGCDADIDDNPFLRLSKTHKLKSIHRFQHIYAPFLYCLYTLHWILLKDFMYLGKKRVANMKDLS